MKLKKVINELANMEEIKEYIIKVIRIKPQKVIVLFHCPAFSNKHLDTIAAEKFLQLNVLKIGWRYYNYWNDKKKKKYVLSAGA